MYALEKSVKALFVIAAALSLLLVSGAVWSINPLRDAALMDPVSGFHLQAPLSFLLLAPLFNVLDLLTSLSTTQHAAMILLPLLVVLIYTVATGLSHSSPLQLLWIVTKRLVITFIVILVFYAMAMFMPRPMIGLAAEDKDIVLVDFHSHTDYSHDANKWFTAEHNRSWHEGAGFHAVFVTDHKSYQGIKEGKAANAPVAGNGVQLLDAIEAYHKDRHVLALCATETTAAEDTYEWKPLTGGEAPCEPLLVQALPGPVADSAENYKAREIRAIELHDGAPLALEEIKNRATLVAKAREVNIAMVSGSDNHGWAYAAMGWSALRIPGWQQMNADQLALAITNEIRSKGFHAVQVVERNMLLPAASIAEHFIMPLKQVWRMFQWMSFTERLSWFAWLSIILFIIYRRKI